MLIDTLTKFGYPDTLLWETPHWLVLLRQKQVTLGSLIVIHKGEASSLGAVPAEAWTAFPAVAAACERALRDAFGAEKFNWLALMMVDPEAHFHLLPRYSVPQEFAGITFTDAPWPKPPDLALANTVSPEVCSALKERLRPLFKQ